MSVKNSSANGYPLLIKDLLESEQCKCSDQEIVYGDMRLGYSELRERISRLASGLKNLGVGPGDTVAVMDWDSHRYLESFFAVPMMGAVLHTVNVRLSPEQILYTINHAEDDVILVNSDFLPVLEQIWDRVETVKHLVVLIDDGLNAPTTPLKCSAEYEALLSDSQPGFCFPALDEDTLATTFYTTGTTGLPKGVYFSHRQLVQHTLVAGNAFGGAVHGGFAVGDVYMPITPMFHVHAWGMPYLATLLGVKQVYPGRYLPDNLLALIAQEGVTFSHCVPTILQMLFASEKLADIDLSRWKVVIGGSALPHALATQALNLGIDVLTGYGMSETCPLLTLSHLKPHMLDWNAERQALVRCKAGQPVPLVKLRIVDEMMNDMPRDGVSQGEVVVRAPWLTQGYLKDTKNSESLWQGGWLHTGDIGVIDEEGYLKITDRIKDVIKTGGEWISSLDLEDLILKYPGVSETAVIGVPDEKWGERPMAMVVLVAGETESQATQAIKEHLLGYVEQGVLSKYGIPEQITVVDSIPKTSVGKLNKKLIREQTVAG